MKLPGKEKRTWRWWVSIPVIIVFVIVVYVIRAPLATLAVVRELLKWIRLEQRYDNFVGKKIIQPWMRWVFQENKP